MRSLLFFIPLALVLAGCRTNEARTNSASSPTQTEASNSGHQPLIASPLPASAEPPTRPYVYISREVKRPGLYTYSTGMTLTDAISSAGGFTEFAGRSRIRVFHKDHSVAGVYDYDRILKHKAGDPALAPGDYISVTGSLD
jgi:polysaccharide biosynthesis/export protein